LDAVTVKIAENELSRTTIPKFFDSMREVSLLGLNIELLNEQTLASEVFTFIPYLSSLYLSYNEDIPITQKKENMATNRGSDSGLIKRSEPETNIY
jgi:hypothetical protein